MSAGPGVIAFTHLYHQDLVRDNVLQSIPRSEQEGVGDRERTA